MHRPEVARAASHPSRRGTAIAMGLSLALSAGIHAVVVDAHLREWWAAGAFFIAAAIVQAACAYMVLVSRDDRAARWGAIVSVLLVTAWAISRTVGIPFGPGRGVREAVGGLDVLATSAEIFAVGAFFALRTRRLNGLVSRTSRGLALAAVGLTFGLGAATAAAMPAHSHSDDAARSSTSEERQMAPQPAAGEGEPTEGRAEREDDDPHRAEAHEHPRGGE